MNFVFVISFALFVIAAPVLACLLMAIRCDKWEAEDDKQGVDPGTNI